MSDSHGHEHDDHGEKKGGGRGFLFDWFLAKGLNYATGGIDLTDIIAKIVAFVLIVMSIGALIGYIIAQREAPFLLVFAPAALAIIAYYERDIAIVLFVALLLFVVF